MKKLTKLSVMVGMLSILGGCNTFNDILVKNIDLFQYDEEKLSLYDGNVKIYLRSTIHYSDESLSVINKRFTQAMLQLQRTFAANYGFKNEYYVFPFKCERDTNLEKQNKQLHNAKLNVYFCGGYSKGSNTKLRLSDGSACMISTLSIGSYGSGCIRYSGRKPPRERRPYDTKITFFVYTIDEAKKHDRPEVNKAPSGTKTIIQYDIEGPKEFLHQADSEIFKSILVR